ncbi:VanZ family protein [Colwellia sp. MB3u-70]|uniref:VanZ family protein n=1 Tax=unclassified Colwellia TaxID=196834 RepID=UPI0015F3EF30|nr:MULTISPECIES: VanZ family protein [unclassified Colwellia]MBA6291944.1 VanZ family protein [Colwellia sp. MB3u-8]MBA6308588.1 VanZ family protein [Colwellia sp. MB3u-70]
MTNTAMKSRYHLSILAIIVMLFFCFYFSSEDLRRIAFRSTEIDSIGHIISFFCLTWVLHSIVKLPLFNTMLTVAFYGILTELGQYYLGFRSAQVSDFISDLIGIALFGVIRWVILIYRNRSSNNSTS